MNFTVEETNFIAIFRADTLAGTLKWINTALQHIDNEDMIVVAESVVRKLTALTEPEFTALSFTSDNDMDEGGGYAEII